MRTLLSPALLLIALVGFLLGTAGCDPAEPVSKATPSTPAPPAPVPPTPPVPDDTLPNSAADSASGVQGEAAEDPSIELSLAPWQEIITAAKQAGKPAVLDIWSLNCEPCMREFPGLVRLQSQYGDRLACISANIDYDGRRTHPPETYQEDVQDFLQRTEARTTNYLCTTPSDEVYETVDIVSIPAVLVFDAEGNEVARFVDAGETIGFTYDKDVIPQVAKMFPLP